MLANTAACRGSEQERTKIVKLWATQLNNELPLTHLGGSSGFQPPLQHLFVCFSCILSSLQHRSQNCQLIQDRHDNHSKSDVTTLCSEWTTVQQKDRSCWIPGSPSPWSHITWWEGAGGSSLPVSTPWVGHKRPTTPVESTLLPEQEFISDGKSQAALFRLSHHKRNVWGLWFHHKVCSK